MRITDQVILTLTQFLFFVNWGIIVLQYCVGFCHTSTGISHRYACIFWVLNTPPSSSPSFPSRWVELPVSHRKFPLAIFFTYGNYVFSVNSLSSSYPLLCPSPNPHQGPELPLGKNQFLFRCLTIEILSSFTSCGLCQYNENKILSHELLKTAHSLSVLSLL